MTILVTGLFLTVTIIIKNDQHEISLPTVHNMKTFWEFYSLICADESHYGFSLDLAILRVNPAGHRYGNQSTYTKGALCQVSCFAHNLNDLPKFRSLSLVQDKL